jgi:hypothetical protein
MNKADWIDFWGTLFLFALVEPKTTLYAGIFHVFIGGKKI